MRYWGQKKEEIKNLPSMQGHLIDTSTIANKMLYVTSIDRFLFLFENRLQVTKGASSALCCFNWKRNSTSPMIIKESPPRAAVGMIDLSKVVDIAEELCDEQGKEPHHLLHLNDATFEVVNQPIHDWSTRLGLIQTFYSNDTVTGSVLVC